MAGIYAVTITDAKGCTKIVSGISVTQPAAGLSLSATQINPSCNGSTNGSIDLSVTGGTAGYGYAWTGPGGFTSSSEDIGSRPAGTYSVVVTDSKGCTANLSVTLTQPAVLSLSTSITHPSCPSTVTTLGNNGAINLTVTGGTTAYGFVWTASNGGIVPGGQANQEDLTLLVAGTYSVTVTDSKGCTATTSATLTNLNPIPVQPGVINH